MISITVKKEPEYGEEFESEGYRTQCTLSVGEESPAPSVVKALIDAMKLEGFHLSSIINSLITQAIELSEGATVSGDFLEYDLEIIKNAEKN